MPLFARSCAAIVLRMLLSIHIAAGGLAIVLGAVALSVKKGGTLHRRTGMLFVYAMLVMGISASMLGLQKGLTDPNVFAGMTIAYFVVTALITVRPPSSWTRAILIVALTYAVTRALFVLAGAAQAFTSPSRSLNGVPFGVIVFFGAAMVVAAIGDVRVLRSGTPRGGARLTRHLWRMCFALFIAAASFFSIRSRVAKVLPEPFTTGPMRALPLLLLLGATLYWLWRVRGRRTIATYRESPAPPALQETGSRSR